MRSPFLIIYADRKAILGVSDAWEDLSKEWKRQVLESMDVWIKEQKDKLNEVLET